MRIESVLAPLVTLLVLAIEAAVAGGAFAFSAWVVWRLMEQRRTTPRERRGGWPLPALFLALTVVGAVLFALGSRSAGGRPLYISLLSLVPFLVLSLAFCGVVSVVRRALRGTPQ